MYHDHGIVVRLEARGYEIEEFGYPRNQDPADPDWNDTRAIISAKPKTHFSVVLELTEKSPFHCYGSEAYYCDRPPPTSTWRS